MESLSLFTNNKERRYFYIILAFLFTFNLYLHYLDFQEFTHNEVFETNATIVNIYKKSKYDILKLQTKNFICFTKNNKKSTLRNFDTINILIVSHNISFYSYLKGFYAKSFNIHKLNKNISNKEKVYSLIDSQHNNKDITSLYSALFLATPLSTQIRDLSSIFGISHLIAISGFHLGVISFLFYFIINPIYSKIHQEIFPYRNKKFDIMIIISIILFGYLYFLNIPPSLLRAFLMFIFGLFLLRNNIKIISFETLFIITILIISFFPKLLFSLSLWFSISGVFYIFLFLKYFKNYNKYLQIVLFNFWIYMAMNPITHYFFGTLSKEQLLSPVVTLLFTIFYPITVLLHILNLGDLFDESLENIISLHFYSIEVFTPLWLFIAYILISLFSILNTRGFIVFNCILLVYNAWLFHFIF